MIPMQYARFCMFLAMLLSLILSVAFAYEPHYAQTPAGQMEIKTLPPARIVQTAFDRNTYPKSTRDSFERLLAFVRARHLDLRIPVVVMPEQSVMQFYMPPQSPLSKTKEISVLATPAKTVASIGINGKYSRENFNYGKQQLLNWLASRPDWQIAGPAYVVYWSMPYMPACFKYSEVHLPVIKRNPALASQERDSF